MSEPRCEYGAFGLRCHLVPEHWGDHELWIPRAAEAAQSPPAFCQHGELTHPCALPEVERLRAELADEHETADNGFHATFKQIQRCQEAGHVAGGGCCGPCLLKATRAWSFATAIDKSQRRDLLAEPTAAQCPQEEESRFPEGSAGQLAETVVAWADFSLAHLSEHEPTYWIKNLRLVGAKWLREHAETGRSVSDRPPVNPPVASADPELVDLLRGALTEFQWGGNEKARNFSRRAVSALSRLAGQEGQNGK